MKKVTIAFYHQRNLYNFNIVYLLIITAQARLCMHIYIYVYIYLPGSIWYTQDKQVHWLTQLIMDNSSDVRKRRPLASLPRYLGMLFSIYIYTYISTLEHFFTVCWFKIHKQACTQQVFGKCNDITGIDLLKFIYFSLMSHLNFFFICMVT